jgi:hypothetical protein
MASATNSWYVFSLSQTFPLYSGAFFCIVD